MWKIGYPKGLLDERLKSPVFFYVFLHFENFTAAARVIPAATDSRAMI